jgi:hypothetical protein
MEEEELNIDPATGLQGEPQSNKQFEAFDMDFDTVSEDEIQTIIDESPKSEPKQKSFDDLMSESFEEIAQDDEAYQALSEVEDYSALSSDMTLKFDELKERLGDFNVNDDLTLKLAESQSGMEQFGSALGRLTTIPFNMLGSLAAMADLEDYFNSDDEVGNWVSSWAEEKVSEVNDYFPIYRENPGEAFDIFDSGWWFENGSGLVNSISEFAALGAMTGGAGAGVRWLSGLKKASDGTKLAAGFDTLTSSFMLNQAEALKSSTGVYKSVYDKAIAQGIDPLEAGQKASDAASYTMNLNRLNIALNLTSAARFLKDPAVTRGALLEGAKNKLLKDVGSESAQEFLEEEINVVAEKEGNRLGDALLSDKKYEYDISNTLSDVTSAEGLEAGVLGAVGGAGQTIATEAVNTVPYRKRFKQDAQGNIQYSTKGSLAYIDQGLVDKVNNLYTSATTDIKDRPNFKVTPLEKDGKKLGWVVDVNGNRITVKPDDEEAKKKYGIEQPEGETGISTITKEQIIEATGLAENDPRLNRILKMHNKAVEVGAKSLNDPKLKTAGKQYDVSEKEAEKEWYSLKQENKQREDKLKAQFQELHKATEETDFTLVDVMASAEEQIKQKNRLDLIDVISDPTVYKSSVKREAIFDKMMAYAENLEGQAKKDYEASIYEINNASLEELEGLRERENRKMLGAQVKNYAAAGSLEKLEELYQRVSKMTPEEAQQKGYGADYVTKANNALQEIKNLEKIYKRVGGRYGKEIDGAMFDEAVKEQNLREKVSKLTRKLDLAKSRNELDEKFVWGQAVVDPADIPQLEKELEAAKKELSASSDKLNSLKTVKGQEKHLTEKSLERRKVLREQSVLKKLYEMQQDQIKEDSSEGQVYFYKDTPVVLTQEENPNSLFGFKYVLIDPMSGEAVADVNENILRALVNNSKSRAKYNEWLKAEQEAAVLEAKAKILDDYLRNLLDKETNLNNRREKTKKDIEAVEEVGMNIYNQLMAEANVADIEFAGSTYTFHLFNGEMVNTKTGKVIDPNSPRYRTIVRDNNDIKEARLRAEEHINNIEQKQKDVEKFNNILDNLQKEKDLVRSYINLLDNKEDFLRDTPKRFSELFEEVENRMGSTYRRDNLKRAIQQAEAKQAEVVDLLKLIDAQIQQGAVPAQDMQTLRDFAVQQRANLAEIQAKTAGLQESLRQYYEDEEIKAVIEDIIDFYKKAQVEASKTTDKTVDYANQQANNRDSDSSPEAIESDTDEFEEKSKARKISAYTTAGNDLADDSPESQRWFRTISKLKEADAKNNYKLEFMTREEAEKRVSEDPAYSTVFSERDKNYEQYEMEEDGVTPKVDMNGNPIPRTEPYKGIRAVLVDNDGKLVKANSLGDISANAEYAVSSYIHNPDGNVVVYKDANGDLQTKLSLVHLIQTNTKYNSKKGVPYSKSSIEKYLNSNSPITVNGHKFDNGKAFKEDVLKDIYNALQDTRKNIFSSIEDGYKVYSSIKGLSSGHPLREKRNYEGERVQKDIVGTFVDKRKDIITVDVNSRGEVYADDNKGRTLDLIPRTLDDAEVDTVTAMLHGALTNMQNGKPAPLVIKGNEYNVFPVKEKADNNYLYAPIETYLYWGKAKTGANKDYQIYFDKDLGRLFFGANDSIPFEMILESEDLRTFLRSKRLNYNRRIKHTIGSSSDKTFKRIEQKNGQLVIQKYGRPNDSTLTGYDAFILSNYKTDLKDNTPERPNFAQRYVTFDSKIETVSKGGKPSSAPVSTTPSSPAPAASPSGGAPYSKTPTGSTTGPTKTGKRNRNLSGSGKKTGGGAQPNPQSGNLDKDGVMSHSKIISVKRSMMEKASANPELPWFQTDAVNDAISKIYDSEVALGSTPEAAMGRIVDLFNNRAGLSEDFDASTANPFLATTKEFTDMIMTNGFNKLVPVETVKLHNFITKNATLLKEKGLSLDPAMYEGMMRSTTDNVDTFLSVLENYLNC